MLTPQQQEEHDAFRNFVARLRQADLWLSITSRNPPEPDLLCEHATRGTIAFELISLTDPTIAAIQAAGPRAYIGAFSTSDPSESIVTRKLTRTYTTTAPRIELLIYTAGQIITADDQITATISPLLGKSVHPFAEVWFMGEIETKSLWRAS